MNRTLTHKNEMCNSLNGIVRNLMECKYCTLNIGTLTDFAITRMQARGRVCVSVSLYCCACSLPSAQHQFSLAL